MNFDEVTKQLEYELRKVYDNDEFVRCIMSETKKPARRRKMLAYILTSKDNGDDVIYEELVLLPLIIKRKGI